MKAPVVFCKTCPLGGHLPLAVEEPILHVDIEVPFHDVCLEGEHWRRKCQRQCQHGTPRKVFYAFKKKPGKKYLKNWKIKKPQIIIKPGNSKDWHRRDEPLMGCLRHLQAQDIEAAITAQPQAHVVRGWLARKPSCELLDAKRQLPEDLQFLCAPQVQRPFKTTKTPLDTKNKRDSDFKGWFSARKGNF